VRILLAIHNAYTDATSGAAQSMRILMEWLVQGGHECRVLGTARFDAKPPDSLDAHLAELEVEIRRHPAAKAFVRSVRKPANVVVGRPTASFVLEDVPVRMLMTRAALRSPAEAYELQQLLFLLDDELAQFKPDVVVSYGGHPVIQEVMHRARRRGALTVFSLRNHGYDDRRLFQHVDHVFTTSPYLTAVYRQAIGLRSTGLDSPIEWADVEAPDEMRRFVTFVNPTLPKGAMMFARLAAMLGERRPDIPVLVVQSAASAGRLNAIPGLDFTKYPHIMAAPATPRPADFFALTKILLVPSVFREPFGRVAAEALINGIPPLVSDRGALPETVRGAGRVLPMPARFTETTQDLATVEEAQPWFDAVCELWDDGHAYKAACALAKKTALTWYDEAIMRQRYLDYFASLDQPAPLFDAEAPPGYPPPES
jgi:glycosyltransferase involved in cell wall biosynthesis